MLIGFVIILILLWIRTEYLFLLFYVVANVVLVFLLFDVWVLTWADALDYALGVGLSIAVSLAVGAVFVALFKWLKTRKTGRDKQLDKEMERIRAEIAARQQSPP
jgi:glucan phosphoethanolaminetransferase (alkaline phosphatase superfamily)